MRFYAIGALVVSGVASLIALPAFAQAFDSIRVTDQKVYADLPSTPLPQVLQQLADAAGVELKLRGEYPTEVELYANGTSLQRVVDSIIPAGAGFVLESDENSNATRLIIFSKDQPGTQLASTNERQQYLVRQTGKRDDGTADLMQETLADRKLDDAQSKLTAIAQLEDMDSDHATKHLEAGIGDPDPIVRLATARALYRLQGDEAIRLIGQIYYAEGSEAIRKEVAAVVKKSSHPLAQRLVIESGVKRPGPVGSP